MIRDGALARAIARKFKVVGSNLTLTYDFFIVFTMFRRSDLIIDQECFIKATYFLENIKNLNY